MTKSRPLPAGADRREPKANDTDFLDRRWMGKQASDLFFSLRVRPEFQGLGSDAVLLPANTLSISRHPQTAGAVMEAYANGLVCTDQLSRMNGAAAVGGLINLPLLVVGTWHFATLPDKDAMAVLALVLCVPLAAIVYFLLRFDITGYRYAPVLFDRAAGKVHVFTDETRLFNALPLWGGGKYQIQSFDWRCVRAQIGRFRTFTGNVSQDNAALTCVAIKAPDDAEVVGQFGVGPTVDTQSLQILLDRWEHLRRFMECEGPLFVSGDGPYVPPTTQSFGGALFWGQPLLGPGNGAYRHPWRWSMLFAQILLLAVLPLSMLFGLVRWFTYRLKGQPEWPPDVRASVGGGPLDAQQLEGWHDAVPSRRPPDPHA